MIRMLALIIVISFAAFLMMLPLTGSLTGSGALIVFVGGFIFLVASFNELRRVLR